MKAKECVDLARLYAKVFAGSPWFEVTRDAKCGQFFGPDTAPGQLCPDCKTTRLEEAYPLDKTSSKIAGEFSMPKARLIVPKSTILTGRKPLGFAWGYETSVQDMVFDKYPAESWGEVIALLGDSGLPPGQLVYYMSECGVTESKRNRGLGTKLTAGLLQIAKNFDSDAVLRTQRGETAYRIAINCGMEETNFCDPVNSKRVMLRKKK